MILARRLAIAVIFVALCGPAYAEDFLLPESLRPGMKGYGMSVFKGWEPERFEVEIVDIMRGVSPKKDIILARLSGGMLEQTGVIAGMSGSPVYIDGKLVGAVAFAWPFAKEPLCGIQPIGQMIAEKKTGVLPRTGGTGSGMKTEDRLQYIATPVSVSGFVKEGKEFIKKFFETSAPGGPYLLSTVGQDGTSGFQSRAGQTTVSRFKGGDAVAVNMVDGDFRVEAVGTVTYVSNDDIFIFGHPLDLSGNSRLPVSRSYIYSVIPSLQVSFKLGASSEPLGATVYDGPSGVYCRTGDVPAMVPVDLVIRSETGRPAENRYAFRVTDNPGYFPNLAAGAVSSALIDHVGYFDDKRVEMDFEINVVYGGERRSVRNKFRYAFNPSYFSVYAMIGDLMQYFSLFVLNPFRAIRLESVRVAVRVEQGVIYSTLEQFSLDRNTYYPGDVIRGRAVLREYKGVYRTEDFTVRVPEKASPGSYWVLCGSEPSFYNEISKSFPKYYVINSLDDLVRLANMREDPAVLVFGLYTAKPGVWVQDKKMERLPEGYQGLFSRVTDKAGAVYFPDLRVEKREQTGSVFGSQKVPVTILPASYKGTE